MLHFYFVSPIYPCQFWQASVPCFVPTACRCCYHVSMGVLCSRWCTLFISCYASHFACKSKARMLSEFDSKRQEIRRAVTPYFGSFLHLKALKSHSCGLRYSSVLGHDIFWQGKRQRMPTQKVKKYLKFEFSAIQNCCTLSGSEIKSHCSFWSVTSTWKFHWRMATGFYLCVPTVA